MYGLLIMALGLGMAFRGHADSRKFLKFSGVGFMIVGISLAALRFYVDAMIA